MIIAVLAANGRTGKAFVKAALATSHTIRAGSLRTGSLAPHDALTEFQCDATNLKEVSNLITGSDAVASFIGHVKGSPAAVQTDAMRVLVEAMQAQGIRRLVSLTGTGVRAPGDRITLIDRFLNFGVGLIDPARVADGRSHAEVLKESTLEWTIIRVLKLQNVAPRPFVLTPHGPTKIYVGREEVAQAALEVLQNNSFIKQLPIISPQK